MECKLTTIKPFDMIDGQMLAARQGAILARLADGAISAEEAIKLFYQKRAWRASLIYAY